MILDLVFPVAGTAVPTDHAYHLYSALSRVVPDFHEPDSGLRFAPLTGSRAERGCLLVTERSRLRVRIPDSCLAAVLPLSGAELSVGDRTIRLLPPTVEQLTAAPILEASLVTLKNSQGPDEFLASAERKLLADGIDGRLSIRAFEAGPRAGEPRRRVVRVKGKAIVGYAVVVSELTPADSIRLQERGLGGRQKIGCGFFLPHRPRV